MDFLPSTFPQGSSRRQFSFRENSCLCIRVHVQIWRKTDLCHLCLERLCPFPHIGASGVESGLNYHKPALFLVVGLWLLITITRLTSLLRTVPHTQVVKTLCCFVSVETTDAGYSGPNAPVANRHSCYCSVARGVSIERHFQYVRLYSVDWKGYGRKEPGIIGAYAWRKLRKPRKTALI